MGDLKTAMQIVFQGKSLKRVITGFTLFKLSKAIDKISLKHARRVHIY